MALQIRNLTKKYKNGRGIHDISFEIQRGDIYGLLGPNGSGKSTTLKIITGLSHADQGSVQIFGRSLANEREKTLEQVGCLIEAPAVYEYMSAKQNLELAAAYYNDIKASHVKEALRETNLLAYQHDKVKEFSLGMKQRLGLALALLSNPDLVILDEPANGLDIEGMVAIREIILEQAQSKGITFVISSHLAHELEMVCNKIAIIKGGKLLRTATIAEVKEHSDSLERYFLEAVGGIKEEALWG